MSSKQPSRGIGARRQAVSAARPAGSARRARRRPTTPADQLVARLRGMETALHETLASFAERVSAQFQRAAKAASATPAPKRGLIVAMAERLDEVKLKPDRGRLKDLVRLQELAEDLADLLPDA